MKGTNSLYWIFVILLLTPAMVTAQKSAISDYHNIKFEYHRNNSRPNGSLVIMVPGFTQHNRSPEFQLLKEYFQDHGFSCLIMNPPQHGEDFIASRIYTWGEREVRDLLALALDSLHVFQNHTAVHLLGFSIGAKIVLNFAAHPRVRTKIASTIAVAAPFRVGAINMQVLGKGVNPVEGLMSSFAANRRAGFLRMGYMIFPGMFVGLFKNRASPAENIAKIESPLLLLHGSDDWLTKSYHSKQLFEKARAHQRISFIALKTPIHAEDMLTRGSAELRSAFFNILSHWYDFIRLPEDANSGLKFNDRFTPLVKSKSPEAALNFPIDNISPISTPVLVNRTAHIWTTPANRNPAALSLHHVFEQKGRSSYFLSFGSPAQRQFYQRFQGGIAFEKNSGDNFVQNTLYLSMYYPFGTFLWMRKLSYIHGFEKGENRKILSADLAFLLLDFQLNYGRIRSGMSNDLQLNFNIPLISPADARFFCGLQFNRFLKAGPPENDLSIYWFLGPKIRKSRWHFFTEYHFLQKSGWRFGVSGYLFDN